MSKRIYLVQANGAKTLVNASSKSQAMSFVARQFVSVDVATQRDLVDLLQQGWKVAEAVETQLPLEIEE